MVFVRFAVLRKFEFPLSRGWILGSFWEAFGDHWVFFFEGVRKMLEFRRIFNECRRPRYAQARGVRGGVPGVIRGPNFPSRTLP